jgi:hypothetical protein
MVTVFSPLLFALLDEALDMAALVVELALFKLELVELVLSDDAAECCELELRLLLFAADEFGDGSVLT